METNNAKLAVEYYTLYGEKNAAGIKKYLHPDVELHSPMAKAVGKEAVFAATSNFISQLKSLRIRAQFAAGDQAMIVYDSDISGIMDGMPAASLLNFRDGLIIKIELFFDSRHVLR